MMTIDDKGGGGGKNRQKNDDVIYDSSLSFTGTFLSFFFNFQAKLVFLAPVQFSVFYGQNIDVNGQTLDFLKG